MDADYPFRYGKNFATQYNKKKVDDYSLQRISETGNLGTFCSTFVFNYGSLIIILFILL